MNFEQEVEDNELRRALLSAVQALPEEERAVLSLRFYGQQNGHQLFQHGPKSQGLTLDEVAQRLGMEREQVNGLERKALKRLKVTMAPWNGAANHTSKNRFK